MQQEIELLPLDPENFNHLKLMFDVRTHPLVDQFLTGEPPSNWNEHVNYILGSISKKQFILIICKKEACGYCQATRHEDGIELGWALHPNWWGKGIGKIVVDATVNHFSNMQSRIFLWVRTENHRAIHIYQSQGFRIKKFDLPRNEILMEFNQDIY